MIEYGWVLLARWKVTPLCTRKKKHRQVAGALLCFCNLLNQHSNRVLQEFFKRLEEGCAYCTVHATVVTA